MEGKEEEDEELEAGGGIQEDSLLGGEGVRARTSTTFRSFDNDDAVAEEEEGEVFIALSAPELGESERLANPTARVAALTGTKTRAIRRKQRKPITEIPSFDYILYYLCPNRNL